MKGREHLTCGVGGNRGRELVDAGWVEEEETGGDSPGIVIGGIGGRARPDKTLAGDGCRRANALPGVG